MRAPRPFQLQQFESVRDAFRAGKRGVVVASPTGTGKAVSIALITKMTREKGGRVLILVNRDILVTQLLDELRTVEVFAQREQAGDYAALTADVVVASIQSLTGNRLSKWPRNHFVLCILDECHSSGAASPKRVLDHFESSYHCGFTATPERHDKKGLWHGFKDLVFNYSLNDAINDGWLCGFDFVELDCPVTIDLIVAKKSIIGENEEVFDSTIYLPRLAQCAWAESQQRKGLFFLPNCRISKRFAEMLRELGLNARHIDSSYMKVERRKDYNVTMEPERTEEYLEWFAAQQYAILCNSDYLSYGYNHPPVDLIGLFRPIASTPMYKQRLGRATRPIAPVDNYATADERKVAIAASAKPVAKVLNVFWENGSHDLASPSCLLTDDREEQMELNKKRKLGTKVNLEQMELGLKAMRNEAEELRKFAEKVANSQAAKKRKAPFIGHILKIPHNGNAATSGQMWYLRKIGYVHQGAPLSKQQAFKITELYKKQMEVAV